MNKLAAIENAEPLKKEVHSDKTLTVLQKSIVIGQYDKAEETFLKAHKFDPINPDINYNLDFFAELKGNYD